MESPYGEGAAGAELGARGGRVCPAYDPDTGVLDLTKLAFDPNLEIRPFGAGRLGDPLLPACDLIKVFHLSRNCMLPDI
jgi:hypothetical protein